jgi:hypothetical protein
MHQACGAGCLARIRRLGKAAPHDFILLRATRKSKISAIVSDQFYAREIIARSNG